MITYLLHNLTRLPAAPNPTVECAFQSYSQDDNSKKNHWLPEGKH
jgi:hypothetical protein